MANLPASISSLDVQHGGDHYKKFPIQPIEYCQRNKLGAAESFIVKYVTRHRNKAGAEDVKKALHFCQLLLEIEYGIKSNTTYQETKEACPNEN